MKKIFLFIVAVLFVCAQVSFAESDRQARIKGLRAMSMGGAFSAVSDDENAFFYNPAGISQRSGYFLQLFSVDFAFNTNTYDFFKFYSDNKNDLENFDNLTLEEQAELIRKINKDILGTVPEVIASVPNIAFISGPIKISNNYFNIGAGIFSYVDANVQFNRSIIPSLTYEAEATAVAAVPVSYRIVSLSDIKLPGQLSLGANFKYIYRGKVEDDNLSIAEFETLQNVPMQSGGGFGVDLGAIYHINPRWNVGIQLLDAFNTQISYSKFTDDDNPYRSKDAYDATIKPDLTIGAAYVPEKIYYWPGRFITTNNRLTLAADIADMTNSDESITDSFWKKVHFGAEFKFSPFAIRAGFNSGYPAVGGGIVTNYINLEYAFYGEEEGLYAGQDPSWFHRVLFSVKIGNSKGKAYGNNLKKKEKAPKESKKKDKDLKKDDPKEDVKQQPVADDVDDIEPLKLPSDAKDIIERPAEINEVTD